MSTDPKNTDCQEFHQSKPCISYFLVNPVVSFLSLYFVFSFLVFTRLVFHLSCAPLALVSLHAL